MAPSISLARTYGPVDQWKIVVKRGPKPMVSLCLELTLTSGLVIRVEWVGLIVRINLLQLKIQPH